MEFLEEYHLLGLVIGVSTFLIIGLFHPIVVKVEYYWGTRYWITDNVWFAALLGVFSFSSFWTIKEIFEQEERVRKGWFPKNPNRVYSWDNEPNKTE